MNPKTTDAGESTRMTQRSWTEPTMEMHNMRCESAITLRAACEGLGLPTSGSKIALVNRLLDAGMTHALLQAEYGWRSRQFRESAKATGRAPVSYPPAGDTYWAQDKTVTLDPEALQDVGDSQSVLLDGMPIGSVEVCLIPATGKRQPRRYAWKVRLTYTPKHFRTIDPSMDWPTRQSAVQFVIDQYLSVPRPSFHHPGDAEGDAPETVGQES